MINNNKRKNFNNCINSNNNKEKKDHRKVKVLSIFLFFLLYITSCSKSQKSTTETGEKFEFSIFYSQSVSEINCFSVELIEIQEGNNPTAVFPGFFKTKIGEEKQIEIQSVKVRNPKNGQMIEEGKGSIEVFQEKITVYITTPFPPKRPSYLEIRGFYNPAPVDCAQIYGEFIESGIYENLYAIGRSSIIDPKKQRNAIGVLTLVGKSDTFQTYLTTTRAFPMTIEFKQDENSKFRQFLLCGGIDAETKSVLRTCDILDELNMTIETGPIMNFPRIWGAISKSHDGKIFISGGLDREANIIPFVETYDPTLGIFINIRRVIPRFAAFAFSTEKNLGIIGGINSQGNWEKQVEIIPHQSGDELKSVKLLYFLENAGKFGSCVAESQDKIFITGGVNNSPQIVILKKERIDVGTLEVKVNNINSAKVIFPQGTTELTEYGKISFPYTIKSLYGKDIKFGNCKAVYFEGKLVVATSYGEIYFIHLSKDEIIDAFPEDEGIDILGIKIPPSITEFPYSISKSKKGFSFHKLSENKAVVIGGYDYITFSDRTTKMIIPSDEVLLISSNNDIYRYKTAFPREGAFSFLFEEEFMFIVGGSTDKRSEVIFVGNVEYPERIKRQIPLEGEQKQEGEQQGEGGQQ